MRYFKKEGNVKFRKSQDAKLIKDWLEDGFVEVNSDGSLVESKNLNQALKRLINKRMYGNQTEVR